MIVFLVKRRWAGAILSPIICGALGFINSWASIIGGVILLVIAIALPKADSYSGDVKETVEDIAKQKKNEEKLKEYKEALPGDDEWKCPSCGRINKNYVGSCGCGTEKP